MKTALTRKLFLLVFTFSLGVAAAQTKGFIYQPCTNSAIRAILDPNGDGYTSLTTSGFSGTDDYLANSELQMIALPVLFGEASGDIVTGATGGHTDLVSNSSSHSVSVLVKTVSSVQYLVIRFRIGKASTASKGYSLLIDSDNSFGSYLSSNNPGYDREIILETGNPGNVKIYQHTATTTTLQTYSADQYSQRSIAASTNDGDADYFYDFCVPLNEINAASAVRITAATITSAQSGIGGTVSDFNGLPKYSNQFQAMKDITSSFPTGVSFTDLVPGFTFPLLKSIPPVITNNLTTAGTSLTGTSTEANGTMITVYRNRGGTISTLGTTTVSGNAWTLASGISGQLNAADLVFATATASGRSESGASNNIEVASISCYTPAPAITSRANGSQQLSGTWAPVSGTITANTVVVNLYYESGTSLVAETTTASPVYVQTNGSWSLNANVAQNVFSGRVYYVTATFNGCQSTYSAGQNGNTGTITTAPTISTATILASPSISRSVQVQNNHAGTAYLILYRNGVEIGNTNPTSYAQNAAHTFSYTGFAEGDIITARAIATVADSWLSNVSSSVTVVASAVTTSTPVIANSYTSGTGKTVSGICDEAAGTTINLYKNGSTLLGTTTVNVYGAWSVTGLTLAAADVLTATAKASGEIISGTSASVTVAASAPTVPSISTSPIISNTTTSISGTGAVAGGIVILYIDGEQIGTVSTPLAGAWTITVSASSFYKGGKVSAVNSLNSVLGTASAEVTVTGVNNFTLSNTSDASIADQTAGTPFNIKIVAKDNANATFSNYTGSNSVGGTYAIMSGSTTTGFSAGILSSHSLTVTKAGVYTLTTLSSADPSVAGTSNSFTVNPAPANKLRVNTNPSAQNNVNSSFTTQPVIHITDQYNNLRSADGGSTVTAAILSGTSGAVLSGTLTRSVTAGVASFDDLKIDRPGEYVIRFTSSAGLTQVDSDPIFVGRVWRGAGSNDFNTSGNWSNSTIPSANDDIAFAQTPTNDLYLDADRVITNYYNHSTNNKKLIVNGRKLTIKGTISHSAASIDASATSSEVEFNGSSAQAIAANTFVGNSAYKLRINNAAGVSLNGTMAITGELAPAAGVFATNNNLTLKSTSVANTAIVSAGSTSGGYITGEVTVERFIPARRAYRLITSPVTTTGSAKPYIRDNWQEGVNNTAAGYINNQNPNPGYGTHISGPQGSAAGFDVTASTNTSLFSWNAATQSWNAVTNTNNTTIAAGATYRLMIRGDRSIDYTTNTPTPTNTILRTRGFLAQGNQPAITLSSSADAWNMIGNPYQSQVDMTAVSKTNLKSFYYVWDPQRGTRGAWVTYDFSTGSNVAGSAVNQYLQPAQSFFMQTSAAAAASITFNESHKNNTNTFTAVHRAKSNLTRLFATLNYTDSLASNAAAADGFMVAFDPSFSNTTADDVPKLGNMDENFSIQRSGNLLALEKRNFPAVNDSIQVYINQYTSDRYTIRLNWQNPVAGGPNAYLVDTYLQTEHPVNSNGYTDVDYSVSNSIPATKDPRRFVIVFRNSGVMPVSGIEISAEKTAAGIQVNWTALNELNMKHYEVEESSDGVHFKKASQLNATANNNTAAKYSWLDQQVQQGSNFYRVKGLGLDGAQRYSPVVSLHANSLAASFSVLPNPVKGRRLQLQLANLPEANYELNIIDALGRTVYTSSLKHPGGSSVQQLGLPANTSAGTYFIKLVAAGKVETIPFQIQ